MEWCPLQVVICLKIRTFVVATTTYQKAITDLYAL